MSDRFHPATLPMASRLFTKRLAVLVLAAFAALALAAGTARAASEPFLQQSELTASDPAGQDGLGSAMALSNDGSTLVVGAPNHKQGSTQGSGAVYVFAKSGGSWTQAAELANPHPYPDSQYVPSFGRSVAVSSDGSTIVVGAYDTWDGGSQCAGAFYVFTKSGASWTQTGEVDDATAPVCDVFGTALAVSGDGSAIAVGVEAGPDTVSGGTSTYGAPNAVDVFTQSGGNWSQAAQLTASDGSGADDLGSAVAFSSDGSTIVAGAATDQVGSNAGQGRVYVFSQSGGAWSQSGELAATGGAAGDSLGSSVAVANNGSTVVAGAPNAKTAGNEPVGAAYLFAKSGGTWSQTGELTASDGGEYDVSGDNFGASVALSGDGSLAVVGAPEHQVGIGEQFGDANLQVEGAAYVFADAGGGWSQTDELVASDETPEDAMGSAVAVSDDGSALFVGDSGQSIGNEYLHQGAVYLFAPGPMGSPALNLAAPASATAGSTLDLTSVTATLSGGSWPRLPVLSDSEGTLTFRVFGPQATPPTSCDGGSAESWIAHVAGDGQSYTPNFSSQYVPSQPGDYWWYVSWAGDAYNNPASSTCGTGMAETVLAPASGSSGSSGSPGGSSGGSPSSAPSTTPSSSSTATGGAPAPTAAEFKAALTQALAVTGKAATIAQVLGRGGYATTVAAPSAGRLTIGWYVAEKTTRATHRPALMLVASATVSLHHGGRAKIKVALTGRGRAVLADARSRVLLTAKATFTPARGSAVTASRSVGLGRG